MSCFIGPALLTGRSGEGIALRLQRTARPSLPCAFLPACAFPVCRSRGHFYPIDTESHTAGATEHLPGIWIFVLAGTVGATHGTVPGNAVVGASRLHAVSSNSIWSSRALNLVAAALGSPTPVFSPRKYAPKRFFGLP